jgi:hypothetical protein
MTFDLAKILQSKREFRQRLAARPIEEKLSQLGRTYFSRCRMCHTGRQAIRCPPPRDR